MATIVYNYASWFYEVIKDGAMVAMFYTEEEAKQYILKKGLVLYAKS